MANKSQGYKRTQYLRHRASNKKGGNNKQPLAEVESPLTALVEAYLLSLAVLHYSQGTIDGKRDAFKVFITWCHQRELKQVDDITKLHLESYQRYLFRWRKQNGKPLGISTQRTRIATIKDYFKWLMQHNHILANPASELQLPKAQKRLPKQSLSQGEVKQLLAVPNPRDTLGLRDKTMLEILYSTGIRRSELTSLDLADINHEQQVIYIRQGKGAKDRVVPIGTNALALLNKYLEQARDKLLLNPKQTALFITSYGEAFHPDVLSRMVTRFIKEAGIDKQGSCHLLRHSCATHMLEGGADIRFIQQLLGHEKLDTTAIYTQVSIEQLKAVHAKCHPLEAKVKRKS